MINKKEIYAELYFIFEQVPYSYISKVPKEFIEEIKDKMSIEYYNKFDKNKVFYKQKFNHKTIEYLDYICSKCWDN